MDTTQGTEGLIGTLFAFGFIFIIMFFIIFIAMYVMQALGLYKIAKKEGNDFAWFAWVPILQGFLIPMLVEDDVHESIKGKMTLIYGISIVATLFIGGFIPFISFIPLIVTIYALYFLIGRYSKNEVGHLVVLIVTGTFSLPFQLLYLMNRDPIDKEGRETIEVED